MIVEFQYDCFYSFKGPDAWPLMYEECKGDHQSPIDIQDCRAIYDSKLVPFNLKEYQKNIRFNISHVAHTGTYIEKSLHNHFHSNPSFHNIIHLNSRFFTCKHYNKVYWK